jgi:hypothetical protein
MSENSTHKHRERQIFGEVSIERWLFHVVFGKNVPGGYTMVTVVSGGILSLWLWLWHVLRWFALFNRDLIEQRRGVEVEDMVRFTSLVYKMDASTFLQSLEHFHLISSICWFFILIGIVSIYRKTSAFYWIIFPFLLILLLLYPIFFNWYYFWYETGSTERILFLAITVIFCMYGILLRMDLTTDESTLNSNDG